MKQYLASLLATLNIENYESMCKNVYYWINQIIRDDKLTDSERNELLKQFTAIL